MAEANQMVEKSNEAWALAERLLEEGRSDAAANRFYYALLQAAKAHFVQAGDLDADQADGIHGRIAALIAPTTVGPRGALRRTFNEIKYLRVTADYLPESVPVVQLRALVPRVSELRRGFL